MGSYTCSYLSRGHTFVEPKSREVQYIEFPKMAAAVAL